MFAGGQLANSQVPIKLPPVASAAVPAPASTSLPEPIYWKQQLLLIPYQWQATAPSGAARAVSLFVSKDRGASWQKLSDARPDVRSFTYRAEGDGEHWFAVRTLDQYNRWLPEGPYRPEVRVVVDATVPRIDELQSIPSPDGAIDIVCRATDVNLDPSSLVVETQSGLTTPWQRVHLQQTNNVAVGCIHARFHPTPTARPIAIRATILDRAGNSATFQNAIGGAPATQSISPMPLSNHGFNPFDAANAARGAGNMAAGPSVPPAATQTTLGWHSGFTAPGQAAGTPTTQQWPASAVSPSPFRLWTSGSSPLDDNQTAFGSPQVSTLPTAGTIATATTGPDLPAAYDTRVPAQYASTAREGALASASGWASGPTNVPITPIEPIVERTSNAGPTTLGVSPPEVSSIVSPTAHQPSSPPKLVGSRTFALEYDLDGAEAGIARVELWGTRDGGRSWSRFAIDSDNLSPLVATVDAEGLYGFKILVQNAGARAPNSPSAGDAPELWVAVDLQRPIIELTAIERGTGNLADHLVLNWRAEDNNLEARPIAIYFSSRPGGPWSAIATNLENSGQYAWRVERYVPSKIYLRIEARDTADNMAAFQTREPIECGQTSATARFRTSLKYSRKSQAAITSRR